MDIAAAIQDLPNFVSSFDYSLTDHVFLQQPAAAGRTTHLATLSVQHAARAIQIHRIPLMQHAQQSVCEFVTAQLQELGVVMAQQEVQIVLEAASAAVRASAVAEGQALDGSSPGTATPHPAQHAQREVLDRGTDSEHDRFGMLRGNQGMAHGTGQLQSEWLNRLNAEHLVEFAEMLQTGLQEQHLAGCRQSCMDQICEMISGR